MSIEQSLLERAGNQCELCGSASDLSAMLVPPHAQLTVDTGVVVCDTCKSQMDSGEMDTNHWRCLNDSMWSQVPAVQVMAYRMLKRLSAEPWAQDLLDVMYMDDETRKWAESGAADDDREPTRDSNGALLQAGDNVTLIKDLDVKGAGFTAKRGTMVRGISLTDNPEHIEGRVNGTRIVIISAYTKKA